MSEVGGLRFVKSIQIEKKKYKFLRPISKISRKEKNDQENGNASARNSSNPSRHHAIVLMKLASKLEQSQWQSNTIAVSAQN